MNELSATHRSVAILLREPLLHFALIAGLLLAGFGLFQPSRNDTIAINQREIDARLFLAEMAAGEELQPTQREAISQAYIEQQVLVNEAKRRGLDNDTRIHDILAQKLRHVLSGDIIQPTSEELERFYSENSSVYISPETVSVDELVFNSRSELSSDVLEALKSGLNSAEILELEAGSAAPLPRVSELDLSNIFNAAFAEKVTQASIGEWVGPYQSNRGQHWIQVLERSPVRLPELDEIVDLVRLDWIGVEEDIRLDKEVQALMQQYTVEIVDDAE